MTSYLIQILLRISDIAAEITSLGIVQIYPLSTYSMRGFSPVCLKCVENKAAAGASAPAAAGAGKFS